MSWSNVRLILAREIRDQLRDRRTMFMIVVLPILLYPLLGMAFFQIAQFVRETATRVLVIGAKSLPKEPPLVENNHFAERLFSSAERARLLELTFAPDEPRPGAEPGQELRREAAGVLREGRYDAVLYFAPDFGNRLEMFRQALRDRARHGAEGPSSRDAELKTSLQVPQPEIVYTTANEKSQLAFARLSDVLRRWTDEIRKSNLAAAGVPEWATKPFDVVTADVAEGTGASGAAAWSKVLPVLLLLWAMTGAFYPAVDLCAGEKERGTLETLLSSPARRSEIVLGKLATIMLFSIVTAVLNVVSILIMGQLVLGKLPGFGPIPLIGALWMAVALVPASALFSALCLALAAFARSTKEGQYYLMPLLFITLPLAVLPAASGMDLNLGNSLIPVTGLVLLLRAALEGNAWEALEFLTPVTVVTMGGCLLAIRWAVEQFNSESVLFRESEHLDVGLWLRHLLQDRKPTPTAAGAIFCGIVILLVYFFMGLAMPQWKDFGGFVRSTLVVQLAAVATPALLMTIMLTTSPRKTLLLRCPAWPTLLAAALLAVAAHPVSQAIQEVVLHLYPVNPGMEKSLTEFARALKEPPLWQVALVFAALPAVCEELAFRGFILSGFRQLGHKWRAIICSALLFGFIHGIVQQAMVACLMGLVIGLLAVQSGSILPGMIFHVIHNGLLAASTRASRQIVEDWPSLGNFLRIGNDGALEFTWPVIVAGAVVMIAILVWFLRLPYRKSLEEIRLRRIAKGLQWNG
jgi:sodium transport system permease protein